MTGALTAAAVQMNAGDQLDNNLARAETLVEQAAAQGATLIALPEYFYLMPADDSARLKLAEDDGDGPLQTRMASLARRLGIWLLAGTLPLRAARPDRFFNSSLLYGPNGGRVARYDKMHLFGFDDGGDRYAESDTMQAGDAVVSADTPWGAMRLSVCYDLRFPELYRALPAPTLITAPAAFTRATGQAHWELLLRARAVENLAFVIAPGQCGRHPGGRETFGHSMIVDPWGEVLARQEDGEGAAVARLEFSRQADWRQRLPALRHRRLGDGTRSTSQHGD
ncbi:carbon-nitrogen hydrolase family protein [uncultured Aquitalea sp.]|uniref:carbon-nitrogen hydrolase family protein n=1 Tax=uncultured Aquitalea sp. TaxID=540272 RepID=UPI0025D16CEC|nr:carbon-nitrogen hydrolase family protein [uncultured Aquitalea sp.]